jgi:glutaredoxin 3
MSDVTVYTIDNCPYCEMAKQLLTRRGVNYKEEYVPRTDIQKLSEVRSKTGMRTFPQILQGEKLIGGYTDLAELDKTDALKSLL